MEKLTPSLANWFQFVAANKLRYPIVAVPSIETTFRLLWVALAVDHRTMYWHLIYLRLFQNHWGRGLKSDAKAEAHEIEKTQFKYFQLYQARQQWNWVRWLQVDPNKANSEPAMLGTLYIFLLIKRTAASKCLSFWNQRSWMTDCST